MRGLTAMRRRAGFTVAQLAERLRVTKATIYCWEHGQYSPNAALLPEIAELLGCSIDDLFFAGLDEENNTKEEETP